MASLFGTNQLRLIAQRISTDEIMDKIEIVKRWHDDLHHGTLRFDNETQREQQYNADFFKSILGYVERPVSPFTFEPKSSTASGQIPDARIGYFDTSEGIDETIAVVELKGASINLDRPQRGHANQSPVQQGFKYQSQYRSCSFVIVSNFAELRLYNDNQLDFETWHLDDLVDPALDYLKFKTFYLLLNSKNLPRLNGVSVTEGLLTDVRVQQDIIGARFYEKYSAARLALIRSIYAQNEIAANDLNEVIEKAQKVIDRIVFIAFAEDRGLLPDNTLRKLALSHKTTPLTMWQLLKGLFDGVDRGSGPLAIPIGFNGGLFKHDEVLDDFLVDDLAVLGLLALGQAKFDEELSVTILGHIFEQSITDLQEIRDTVSDESDLLSYSASRRRNDGIYYTPEHMVRHIVDRSLGQYMRDNEQRILADEGLKTDIQDATYVRREQDAYLKYRDFLLRLKVVDPAAGSGAFLVQVYDFLMAENLRVAAILGNDIFSNADLSAQVLRNNIYGVDINEESVEISKLSLWLKSASRGHKLTGLENNIKCGNSLEPEILENGPEEFRWREAFPEVFADGGFDIVVGNPPYIKEFTNKAAFDGLRHKPNYQGKMDLWYLFGDLALDIVKPEVGRIAFIAPNNWITNAGASRFRDRVLTDARILEYYDFGDYMVFEQASIQTMVYVMARTTDNEEYHFPYGRIRDRGIKTTEFVRFLQGAVGPNYQRFEGSVRRSESRGKSLTINDRTVEAMADLITNASTTYFTPDEVATGIDVHQDYLNKKGFLALGGGLPVGSGIFNLSDSEYRAMPLNPAERNLVRPFYTTDEMHRFFGDSRNCQWVIYTDSSFKSAQSMDQMPNLRAHLDKFTDVITSDNAPYGLHRARAAHFFEGEKIMSLRKCARPTFTYTDFDAYVSQTYFVIQTSRWDTRALTAILNSTLVAFWLRAKGKMQGNQYQVDKEPLMGVPLVIPENSERLSLLTQQTISARDDSLSVDETLRASLRSDAPTWVDDHPAWWNLSTDEMLDSMPMIFALNRRGELLELFNTWRPKALDAQIIIRDAEAEIDEIVFSAYNVSPEHQVLMRGVVEGREQAYESV